MTTQQPEALRLADEFERPYWDDGTPHGQLVKAAAELRRLDTVVNRLLRERSINLESGQRDTARIAELENVNVVLMAAIKKFVETEMTVGQRCTDGGQSLLDALAKAEGGEA